MRTRRRLRQRWRVAGRRASHARAEIDRCGLWQLSGAVLRQPRGQGGRGGRRDRPERRRQDHFDAAGLGPVVVQQVFELVNRIRTSGLTVLIVEQNVQQVLRVVDRAYLLEAGSIRASGTSAEIMRTDIVKQAYLGV